MSASFESRKNSQASMITAGFAGLLLLLMFMWKWTIVAVEPPIPEEGILVELNIPEEEIVLPSRAGGGGGGNLVEAPKPAGAAPYSPPDPGTKDDAKDIEETPDKTSPAILKPDLPNPKATKINENKAPPNLPPKPVPVPPAPKPKAVIPTGKTLTGKGEGGGASTTYDRSGGQTGGGNGVGNGPGGGGGTGGGVGGGRGSGVGPYVSKGDRSIVGSYSFQGDLEKATIYADIKVSPDGVGQFIQFARGTSAPNSSYRTAIEQYLRKMKFNKSDHESTITVVFNFKVNG